MKINRENCEAWFLDHYEGNLSKEREEELRAFLAMNPDLQEVFDSFEDVSFDPDKSIKFDGKDALKKEVPVTTGISDSNYTAWIVALAEKDLNAMEEKRVRDFMSTRPNVQREFELLLKSKVQPDTSTALSAGMKDGLKKKVVFTAQNFMEYAVMAMDGALDPFTAESFFDFIAKNKSFEKEYNALLTTKVEADASIVFENKNALKRSPVVITAENFYEFAVAAMDGELDKFTAESFFDFIAKNRSFEKEYRALLATKLVADKSIVFADKDSLKKKERGGIIWWQFASYAAVAAVLLFVVFLYFNRKDVELNPGKAQDIANNVPVKKNNNVVVPNNDTVVPPAPENNVVPKGQYANIYQTKQPSNNPTKQPTIKDFAFVSFPSNNELPVLKTHVYTNVDFSDALYTDMNGTPQVVAQNNSISVTQYAMRWVKNKLDRRTNDDEEVNQDMMAMNGNAKGDVSGFDLTKSAVDRLAYATNSNLDLSKNSDGTVLTLFGYDVIVARN